jgi:hypothetical protein
VVRHVDAIGKTDPSLTAITMTCRMTNAPSISGLRICRCTLQAIASLACRRNYDYQPELAFNRTRVLRTANQPENA